MRRIVGTVLVSLGVFLVVAAGMLRFYAYPALAKVPTNYDETTHLEATGAQVFNTDPQVLKAERSDLAISARTVADSRVHAPSGVAVWNNSTTITRADGTVFQQSRERVPFDAVSGAGVRCETCGSWSESTEGQQDPVVYSGQVYKFPFDTQKHDYQSWDDGIQAATTATYVGQTSIQGLTVYKFVQTIAPTVIAHEQVPGSVFGSKAASVDAEMSYAMVRTFYIEPATGSPVQRVEQRTQVLRFGGDTVPAFVGTVQYTDAQVAHEVHTLKTKALLLKGARTWIPLGGLLAGLVLLGLGIVMTRPEDAAAAAEQDHGTDRPLVGV
jgi:hypothetical protein